MDRLLARHDGARRRLLRRLDKVLVDGEVEEAHDALSLYQQRVEALVEQSVPREARRVGGDMRRLFGVESSAANVYILSQSSNRSTYLNRLYLYIAEAKAISGIAAGIGGLDDLAAPLAAVVPRAKLATLQRGFDYLAAFSLNEAIYIAGHNSLQRKVAVPVLDRDTTDLCKNRMAYQVRQWDEDFVDEKTGAGWLHGPFVGGGLPPSEAFHFCRIVIGPAD